MVAFNVLLSILCVNATYNPLTPEEEHVIVHGGTEPPFTGIYNDHFEAGTYHCRRCDAALYRSDTKFKSGCGWPSFDDEIEGAVRRLPDADGRRTEIRCANCDGHLGHVFLGEGFTEKNTRHCVNALSLRFAPAATATFAGGCFWGVEFFFQKADGVISTQVGYTGGTVEAPTYEQVCHGDTGHAEAVQVVYDPGRTNFETLARLFFEIHDPTQHNRQGPDIGEQYRSAVFYHTEEQRETALQLMKALEENGIKPATQVVEAGTFWPAEDYHQQYYTKRNSKPYCHVYQKRF